MKTYFKKILWQLVVISTCLGTSSCQKYLDKSPLADIDETEAFKDFRNFQGFTEELYNCVPVITAIGSHNNWNFGDEEMWEPTETRLLAYNIDHGDYWAWNTAIFGSWFKSGGNPNNQVRENKGNLWGLSWYGIRKANIGLANLDLLIDATPEERRLIEGQLYFFRGWFHFMLMQYWGGLPYIDTVLPPDEAPRVVRLNYHETAEKVAADLRKAADLLPISWEETAVGPNIGNTDRRANKIMALGFLGKNLLFAGSPLMNEESTGERSYHTEYCKRAADVFGEALNLVESTDRYQLVPFSHYSRIFYTFNQNYAIPGAVVVNNQRYTEAIMMENPANVSDNRFRWNQVNDYRPMTINGSGIKVYPTANYVDYYGMANGLPIKNPTQADSESGYDPEYPWRDRDPRFYHDIMIDGEKAVNNGGLVGNNEYRQYASLFTGGFYRTANPTKAVFTGYMFSKFVSKQMNDWEGFADGNTVLLSLLRLSDVYLMYAESASEGYNSPTGKALGYSKTAVDAVNFVRDRPGLGVGHVAPQFLVSQEAFREEYRRERAVELAFEGHRFVDLRRWLLLSERPYTYKKGIEFDRATPNDEVYADPRNARVRNFRQTILFERQYTQRHYWFPFLVDDISIYEEFPQNPGW
ncbi:RagB/SusD family nutrient uptake outer membrane protein [Sphingobacterium arenae]|uniref:RagB/SusD family nutrient uptake outer membrane protein n=1 Tax=Sphingobacterium arenae TaxID=1280598 RepID=A0ABR7Y1I1_9SPHI|nr:RagB/SusD family nutrient uptake outer membrane protein [Sphingobacterium arenae]MBD1425153.1 RagB/SusD family nutrient uptake outer membrane protein [Sphingobacterium arenae]